MNRRKAIEDGIVIELTDEQSNQIENFVIDKCIGFGGNSIVYQVQRGTSEIGRLKEFFPDLYDVSRNENGIDIDADNESKEYKERLRLFKSVQEKKKELRMLSMDILTTMPEYYQLFRGNQTSYLFQSYSHGYCYADKVENSFESLTKTMIALTNAVKMYHDIGYIHMDIKPENMLVSNQGRNVRVQLFDFETAAALEKIRNGMVKYIPASKGYSAPEQEKGDITKIGISSDLYSVGVILFHKLFNRFPNRMECVIGAVYDIDLEDFIFRSVEPIVKREIEKFFQKTIMASIIPRYKSDMELIQQLETMLELSTKGKGLIENKSAYESNLQTLYGRRDELLQIEERIHENNLVLIYGMGGIGKSELVKHYLYDTKEQYYKIIFIEETNDNIRNVILNDEKVKIDRVARKTDSFFMDCEISDSEYFEIKLKYIGEECVKAKKEGKKLVFVFDNMIALKDSENINKLLRLGCLCIIVSRVNLHGWPDIKRIEVDKIKDRQELYRVFESNYEDSGLPKEEVAAAEKIIDYYDGNTLIIELIAKGMLSSWKKPSEVLKTLEKSGIDAVGSEPIDYLQNKKYNQERVMDIVSDIFNLESNTSREIKVLQFMALLPVDGIEKTIYRRFRIAEGLATIKGLIEKGIVKENRNYIKMHPIIRETVLKKYPLTTRAIKQCIYRLKAILVKECDSHEEFDNLNVYISIGQNLIHFYEVKDPDFFEIMAVTCQKIGLGEFAMEYGKECIRLSKELHGTDSPQTIKANLCMNQICKANDLPDEGLKYVKASEEFCDIQSLKERESIICTVGAGITGIVGVGIIDTAIYQNVIAGMHYEKTSVTHEHEKELVKKKFDMSKIHDQLARYYCFTGDYSKAHKHCKIAYNFCAQALNYYPEAREEISLVLDNKADICFESGNIKDALITHEESIINKKNGYLDAGEGMWFHYLGLAKCNYYQGDYFLAQSNLESAMKLCEEQKGYKHVDTAKIYYYMAKNFEKMNDPQEDIIAMYYSQAEHILCRDYRQSGDWSVKVKADYLLFKVKREQSEVLKYQEEYYELCRLILKQKRPCTVTIKYLYSSMMELAAIFGEDYSEWKKERDAIEEKILSFNDNKSNMQK